MPARSPTAATASNLRRLRPCDAAAACFVACWAFIAMVAVHDAYLVVLCRDVILIAEQNPIGRYLIERNGGDIWLFLLAKGAGTVAVCTLLLMLYHYCRRLALAVTGPLASFQLSLLLYLSLW